MAIATGACLILIVVIALSQNGKAFTVKNSQRISQGQPGTSSIWDKAKSLVGLKEGYESQDEILNQAAQDIFLSKKSSFAQERTKKITDYLIVANNAIPINAPALRLAIGQAALGGYEELDDARERIEKGVLSLRLMTPPAEAAVFHTLSLDLLVSYERILEKIRATPREQVKQAVFADDLNNMSKTASLARTESRFLTSKFDIPYAPARVVQLYDEAIGL